MTMLTIRDLHVEVEGRPILRGLDLELPAGELHAVMGPNGSGKSTLAHVLAGRDGLRVTHGSVELDGRDLLAMATEDRARAGVFLGFQYPVEVPGVSSLYFIKAALNAVRRARGEPELDAFAVMKLAREQAAALGMDEALLRRSLNRGFSGGEKKRHEVFQMAMLQPKLAILDEIDSGLDIDALRAVARAIEGMRAPDRSILLITHYPRLLAHIRPDRVHVLKDGRIAASGGPELADRLDEVGYEAVS